MTFIRSGYDIDEKALLALYQNWPDHYLQASKINIRLDHDPDFYDSLFFCGMGGSATSCDILNDLNRFYGSKPSFVLRGEPLPRIVSHRSLVIVKSVSGNTEEALVMAKEAVQKGAEVICISSGGKLRDYAQSMDLKNISIPNLSLPRASLPYLIMPSLKLISSFLPDSIVNEFVSIPNSLVEEKEHILSRVNGDENISKTIANFIKDSFVFCLSSPFMTSVGTRFKNSLNENAKIHCTNESILESMHNEIVPFTYMYKGLSRKVIFVTSRLDDEFTDHKFKKVQKLFREIGQRYIEIESPAQSLVDAILQMIYRLDFATLYVAIDRGIDPSPTPAIDILKKL